MHTHSRHATMFAQARREIPCLGTTHADHFHGPVPVTRPLERPAKWPRTTRACTGPGDRRALSPGSIPTPCPPCWSPATRRSPGAPSVEKALENSVALEAVAEMVLGTWSIDRCRPGTGAVGAGEALPAQARPGGLLRAVGWVEHGESIAMARCAATVSNRGGALPAIRLRASHRCPVGTGSASPGRVCEWSGWIDANAAQVA